MLPQNDQGYTGTFLHKPVTHLNILPVVVLSVPLFSVNVWTTVKSSMIFPNLSRVAQENNDCQLTFSGTPFLSLIQFVKKIFRQNVPNTSVLDLIPNKLLYKTPEVLLLTVTNIIGTSASNVGTQDECWYTG